MKLLLFFLIVLSPFSMKSQSAIIKNDKLGNGNKSEGIFWENELYWKEIKDKAKKEKKYIFIDAYATWCVPCKKMDQYIYTDVRAGDNMKEKFICVKVQMDRTDSDSRRIKEWYSTADQLKEEYNISGYPSYLFFSPEGLLVHKDAGYKDLSTFIRMSQLAVDPRRPKLYKEYELYKQGIKNYESIDELAEFTRKLIGDVEIAKQMVKEYKVNYLDRLDTSQLFTNEKLELISTYINAINGLVKSSDKIFELAYFRPKMFDSIASRSKRSNAIVIRTIEYEEIESNLIKKDHPVIKHPNWKEIEKRINEKYSKVDAHLLVLNYKLKYYRKNYEDWNIWAKLQDEKIKKYSSKHIGGLSVYFDIDGPAWDAFLKCNNKKVLKMALLWSDLAFKLDSNSRHNYLDTKANLLYKLGKIKNAIETQEKAVEFCKSKYGEESYFKDVLMNMRRGEPTNRDRGAVWNEWSLSNISIAFNREKRTK